MKKKLTTIILLTIFFFMTGCQKRNEKATDENQQNVTTQLNTPDKDVRTIKIEPRDFNYELISSNYSAPIEVSPIGMSDHLTVLQQQELHCISNFRSS